MIEKASADTDGCVAQVFTNVIINKQCGRQVRPTHYAPSRLLPQLFDLESGVRVESKVGNLPPNLGMLGIWVLKLFTMYATDGWTKATLIAPFFMVGA